MPAGGVYRASVGYGMTGVAVRTQRRRREVIGLSACREGAGKKCSNSGQSDKNCRNARYRRLDHAQLPKGWTCASQGGVAVLLVEQSDGLRSGLAAIGVPA